MQKYTLFSILLVAITSISYGQIKSIEPTTNFRMKANEKVRAYLKYDQGEHHLFTSPIYSTRKTKQWLSIVTKTKSYKNLEFFSPYENSYGMQFFILDNKTYRFLLVKEKKSKKMYRKIVEYDKNAELVFKWDINDFNYASYDDFPNHRALISKDSSYVVALDWIDNNEKRDPFSLRMTLLNKEFKVSNTYEYAPKRKDSQRLTEVFNYAVSNDGTVYILIKEYGDKPRQYKTEKRKIIPNYHFELHEIPLEGAAKIHRIENDIDFVRSIQLHFFDDETPYIVAQNMTGYEEDSPTIGISVFIPERDGFKRVVNDFTEDEQKDMQINTRAKFRRKNDFYRLGDSYVSDATSSSFPMLRSYVFYGQKQVIQYQ